jgi:hypothetical protein
MVVGSWARPAQDERTHALMITIAIFLIQLPFEEKYWRVSEDEL